MPICQFCDRAGLLIYPIRYAVACPAASALVSGLSGNFKMVGAARDIAPAKYTLRALRPGYLYTYDEKRKRLKAYLLLPTGQLWHFPTEIAPPSPRLLHFQCSTPGEIVHSYCVDIPHSAADPATNFWIGWSSVLWTKALLNKVGDASWRKKHMQCVDVAAMLAGRAPHAAEFAAHCHDVPHLTLDSTTLKKAFGFSNTSVKGEARSHFWVDQMNSVMASQGPVNKGFLVAVNDPVGITNDMSELVLPTPDAGFNAEFYRGKMVADLIALAKQRVQAEARDEVALDEQIKEQAASIPDPDGGAAGIEGAKTLWKIIKAGGLSNYEKKLQEDKRKYGEGLAARQAAAADDEWKELTWENEKPVLDEKRLNEFPALYAAEVKKFEPIHEQLAKVHAGWLTSEQLAEWMDGVHDPEDIRSGFAYSESVAQCIGKAVSTQPCRNQLQLWLSSPGLSETRNLYSRALLFNQKDLIAAAEPRLKGSDLQIENLLNIYKGALERVENHHAARLIDRLALTTGNILVSGLKKGASSTMRAMTLVHLSLLGGTTIKARNLTSHDLAAWIIAQAKAQGIALDSTRKETRAAARAAAKTAIRANANSADCVAYELDIAKLESEGLIEARSVSSIKIPGVEMTKKWLGSSAPQEFHLGVVTAIVQLAALDFAAKDLANNDKSNETETRVKALISVVSLSATIAETVGTTVEKSTTHPLAVYLREQWSARAEMGAKLARGARTIGAVAGIAAGAYDIFVNGAEAWAEGKKAMASLYFGNGFLGVVIAIAAWYSGALLFPPLLILSFALGLAIAVFAPAPLKQWLSRCYFSQSASVKREKGDHQPYFYNATEDELHAYSEAIGG